MFTVLIVFHVLLAVALIALVLLQRGPGATMGAAFGAGASGTVFGSRGAASFLTRSTAWLALGFFLISLTMAVMAARSGGVVEADDLGIVGSSLDAPAQPLEEQLDPPDETDEEFLPPPDAEDELDESEEMPEAEPPVD